MPFETPSSPGPAQAARDAPRGVRRGTRSALVVVAALSVVGAIVVLGILYLRVAARVDYLSARHARTAAGLAERLRSAIEGNATAVAQAARAAEFVGKAPHGENPAPASGFDDAEFEKQTRSSELLPVAWANVRGCKTPQPDRPAPGELIVRFCRQPPTSRQTTHKQAPQWPTTSSQEVPPSTDRIVYCYQPSTPGLSEPRCVARSIDRLMPISGDAYEKLDIFVVDESGVLRFGKFHTGVRLLRLEHDVPDERAEQQQASAKGPGAPLPLETSAGIWPPVETVLARSHAARVRHSSTEFQLLTEPLTISTRVSVGRVLAEDTPSAETRLAVGILIPADQVRSEATSISLSSTRLLLAALIVLLFVPPLMKVWMSGSRERFRPIEIHFLFISTAALAGLATIVLLHLATAVAMRRAEDQILERASQRLSEELKQALSENVRDLHRFADARAAALVNDTLTEQDFVGCHVPTGGSGPRCLVGALATPRPLGDASHGESDEGRSDASTASTLAAPIDALYAVMPRNARIVVLGDEHGQQIEKWSRGDVITWQVSMQTFSSFTDIRDDVDKRPGGYLLGLNGQPFAFNVQESPNTAEVLYLLSIPFPRIAVSSRHQPIAAIANIELPVEDRTLPFGVSFALVARNGTVLMHEDRARRLHENFLKETGDNPELAATLISGVPASLNSDYHGTPQRMHVAPAGDVPFSFIVFRRADGTTTALLEATLVAASGYLLFGILWLIPVATFSRLWGARGHAWLWPDRVAPARYVPLIFSMFVIALVQIRAIAGRQGLTTLIDVFACGLLAISLAFLALDRRSLPRRSLFRPPFWMPTALARPIRATRDAATWRRVACGFWSVVGLWLFVSTANTTTEALTGTFGMAAIVASATLGKVAHRGARSSSSAIRSLVSSSLAHPRASTARLYVATGTLVLIVVAVLPAVALYRDSLDDQLEQLVTRCDAKVKTTPSANMRSSGATENDPCADVRRLVTTDDPTEQGLAATPDDPSLVRHLRWADGVATQVLSAAGALVGAAGGGASNQASRPANDRLARRLKTWFPIVNDDSGELRNMPTLGKQPLALLYGRSMSALGGALVVALMVVAITWLVSQIAKRVFGVDVTWRPVDGYREAPLPMCGDLLIGPTKEDLDAYRSRNPVPRRKLREIDCSRFATPEKFEALEDVPDLKLARVVWLHRFDHMMNDRRWNKARLEVLERLVGTGRLRLVLVCEIDPLEYIHRRLRSESDPATVDTYVSTVELDRWAHLLMRFRKLWLFEHDSKEQKHPARWHRDWGLAETLDQECRCTPALRSIRQSLLDLPPKTRLGKTDLVLWIEELASAHYRAIWSECTDDEKMLLWRLSHDGFISPRSWPIARRLLRRGLLTLSPNLRPMNDSFRRFVENVEPWHEVLRWQAADRSSPWRSLKPIFVVSLLAVGVALYAAQPDEIGRWMGLITAAAGGLGTLTQILALARGSRGNASPAGEPAGAG